MHPGSRDTFCSICEPSYTLRLLLNISDFETSTIIGYNGRNVHKHSFMIWRAIHMQPLLLPVFI